MGAPTAKSAPFEIFSLPVLRPTLQTRSEFIYSHILLPLVTFHLLFLFQFFSLKYFQIHLNFNSGLPAARKNITKGFGPVGDAMFVLGGAEMELYTGLQTQQQPERPGQRARRSGP